MPQSIPAGLEREHVLKALADLDDGVDHPFGQPTGYELVHNAKRYAPKAAVGLAFQYSIGRILEPEEFSGGEAPGQANFVLRQIGFTVEKIAEDSRDFVEDERRQRFEMWEQLHRRGGPFGVSPSVLREMGVYGSARGIWVNKARTGPITSDGVGVTVSVLHTGRSYADDLAEDCIVYHYPQTNQEGHDRTDINATKTAGRQKLPLFVITYPTPNSKKRDVRIGWVEDWDDKSRRFLIVFGETPPAPESNDDSEESPFVLTARDSRKRRETIVRPSQQRFQFRVLQRYGPECAVCGLAIAKLLDAAHIRPKQSDGSDDPRNGLVFCANHHRAFDAGLFALDPVTLKIQCRSDGPDATALGLRFPSIEHLTNRPHVEALGWHWSKWEQENPR